MSLLSSLQFHYRRWRSLRDAASTLPPPTARERAAITELHRAFAQLPEAPTTGVAANEADWNEAMNRLREAGSCADPRAFLRWDVIVARMAHGNSPATALELAALRQDPAWDSRWRAAIREVPAGHPVPYAKCRESSEALIQTAFHTRAFERMSGRRVNEWDVIVEFGGGFGGFCRLAHALGFRGRYLIFDLPAFTLLQRFYLSQARVLEKNDITLTSSWDELEAFVDSIAPGKAAVFWATWSLSETAPPVRARVRPLVERIGNYCLAYQAEYGDVDNVEFFSREWIDGPVRYESIGHRKNDYYRTGSTK